MKKRSTYLDLGRRQAFGRPIKKILPPLPPPPDPNTVADFDLGSWRVRPSLSRMTRADRIQTLDAQTLSILMILGERPLQPVNRDELATRVFGRGGVEEYGDKLRACLSFLRRVFSEDGSVRIVNARGDCYQFEIGEPVSGRGLRANDSDVLMLMPSGINHWLNRARHRLRAISIASAIVVLLIIGLAVLVGKSTRVTFDPFLNNVPLVTEQGQNLSPQFSPNGQQIVYSHREADGSETLWIKPLSGAAAHALTHGPGRDAFPAWSKTGALIAFQRRSKTDCDVLVINATGGEPRRLGDCEFGGEGPMTWLPEDKALIVTHRTAWSLPTQIISFAQGDGKMTGVSNPASGMPGDQAPTLSADGRRLAFVRSKALGVSDLTLLEQDGAQAKTVTHDALPIHGATWEPAGISMLIASARGGRDALWRSRLDGGRLELALSLSDALRSPTVSPDGRTLVYERWRITSEWVEHTMNESDHGHVLTAMASAHALERGAQRSEDGKRWVFVSNRGGQDQLWIGDITTATVTPLTHSDADYLETPRWSRDGKTVIYTAGHQGQLDIWSVDVASGHEQALTHDGKSKAPSFSRDGHSIYMGSSRNGHWQIWRQPWPQDDKQKPEQITQTGGLAAIESTDGSLLYYVRHDRKGLWQRNRSAGGDESLLSSELAPLDWRNWDVAADAIWFVARKEDSDPVLVRYSFSEGRLLRGPTLPQLLPDSGLTLTPDHSAVWLADVASTQVDLERATLSHMTR